MQQEPPFPTRFSESLLSKLLWLWGVAASFVFCSYLIYNSVSDWMTQPFVSYIESVPIKDFDFPAVTVCPDNWAMCVASYRSVSGHVIYYCHCLSLLPEIACHNWKPSRGTFK